MIVSVQKSGLSGEINAPGSKSYTHRAIFAASLGKKECRLYQCLMSADTKSTMEACRLFGAEIKETEENGRAVLIVNGFGGKPAVPKEIDVGNSGTTLRLMMALSGLCREEITLTGDESIQKRPNTPLIKTLREMGAQVQSKNNNDCAPLTVKGPIKPGHYSIDGGMSSQFISALLLVCPLLKGDSVIQIDGELKSKPYVDITLEIAEKAGIEIQETSSKRTQTNEAAADAADAVINTVANTEFAAADPAINTVAYTEFATANAVLNTVANTEFAAAGAAANKKNPAFLSYFISGNQLYSLSDYTVPGDFSSVSYILAAAALIPNAKVEIQNIFDSAQGDSAIVDVLREMGADVSWDKEAGIIRVSNDEKRLKGIVYDAGKTPDLVPTLAVLGAFSDGEMRITNAAHVRLKETDRLKAMTVELKKAGVFIEETADGLIISGDKSKNLKGAIFHGWDDHRIVMSLFVAGMLLGNTTIDTADSVSISYPHFFEDMKKVGAVFEKQM